MVLWKRNTKGPFTKKLNALENESWNYFVEMLGKKKKNFEITMNGVVTLYFNVEKRTITEKNKWTEEKGTTYTYDEWFKSREVRSVVFIVELADKIRRV